MFQTSKTNLHIPTTQSLIPHPQKFLGKGSFSSVYLSTYPPNNLPNRSNYSNSNSNNNSNNNNSNNPSQIAVKVVQKRAKEVGVSVSLLREVGVLRRLGQHGNIVRFMGYSMGSKEQGKEGNGEEGQEGCLMFEYLPIDLERYINKQPIDPKVTRTIIKQLLQAITYCHTRYIAHRDIKPSNILLNQQHPHNHSSNPNQIIAKLADFGISTLLQQNPRKNTDKLGALYYRAPQVLLHSRYSGFEIDVWGAGCVLGQCLTGRILFQGDNLTEYSQLSRIYQLLQIPEQHRYYTPHPNPEQLKQSPIQQKVPSLQNIQDTKCLDLLNRLLVLNPKRRISAGDALQHQYFGVDDCVEEGVC